MTVDRDEPAPGVVRLTLRAPAYDRAVHAELAAAWGPLGADPDVRAVLVCAAGPDFTAPGDPARQLAGTPEQLVAAAEEARATVLGMLDCPVPIVCAARGWAVGAGLAVLLLADVSIVAHDARLADGHVRIGLAAGDHAAILWPLLCGVAKAKYHLLTGRPVRGEDAERMNLVSLAVDDAELDATALDVATRLAGADPAALRWTKRTINHWLRQATPTFDAALAYETLGMALQERGRGPFLQESG